MKVRALFTKPARRWTHTAVVLIACGIVLAVAGESVRKSLPLIAVVAGALCAGCAVVVARRGRKRTDANPERGEFSLSKQVEQEVSESTDGVDLSVLSAQTSRQQWQAIEQVVDQVLDNCISIIRARLDVFTVAIFFPTNDNGYRLRRFNSRCEFINADAIIYPGVGVIGGFLKEGLKQLNLKDIVTDSMTLYYYSRDARIRSLMASPIVADGTERGTIIVDSTNERNFTDEDHAYLSTVADLCGKAVYYAYLCNEHKIKYGRFSAVTSIEKYFFHKHDIEAVLDKMAEIIPYTVPCDRLTISLRSADGLTGEVRRARGPGSEKFVGATFSPNERTLAGLLYAKNMCFYRNFSADRYEVRYVDNEPRSPEMASFLAYPLGVDQCRGGILLESSRPDAFTDYHRNLLSRFATSAGLALEKITVLEQARSLATHDGLTGLNNHRQFQKLLHDEITRASRYNDAVSLVICDIDHFKKVNDTYGHQFGDTVLVGVAALLHASIRDGVDISARYGGEEFALILVKSDAAQALETVERIRNKVAAASYVTSQGETVRVTMSFGIAVHGLHAKQSDQLIQKADKALYLAKENGRNRAEVFWAEEGR